MAKTKGVAHWAKKLIGPGGVLNDYVKWRDATGVYRDERTGKVYPVAPCITCYKPVMKHSLHAGHWVSRRHKGVAYDEHNIHAQCAGCNKWNGGEVLMYEDEMRIKYGNRETDRIRSYLGKAQKWTPSELEQMYNEYKEKLNHVKKEKCKRY